jgi:hypothetical protein
MKTMAKHACTIDVEVAVELLLFAPGARNTQKKFW